jgi:hypothetical protein
VSQRTLNGMKTPNPRCFGVWGVIGKRVESGVFLVRFLVLVGASRGRTGPFLRLPGRGGCLGGPPTKWGGRGRPAGHMAVPKAGKNTGLS